MNSSTLSWMKRVAPMGAALAVFSSGAALAAPKPWCAPNRSPITALMVIESDVKDAGGSYLSPTVVSSLAHAQCLDDSEAKRKEEAARHLAAFVAASGLTNAEVEELFGFEADLKATQKLAAKFCNEIEVDPQRQSAKAYSARSALQTLLCDRGNGGGYDWVDVTAVEDVLAVRGCAGRLLSDWSDKPRTAYALLDFAQCEAVGQRLDSERYFKEIAAEAGLPRYLAIWAKIHWTDAVARRDELHKRLEKLTANDPALKAAVFEEPAKAIAAFKAQHAKNSALLDKAAELLLNLKNKKIQAKAKKCSEEFRVELAKLFTERKPATEDAAKDVMNEMTPFLLANSLAVCESNDERDPNAYVIAQEVRGVVAAMGPLQAARWAALRYIVEHEDEIDGAEDLRLPRPQLQFDFRTGPAEKEKGTVASVKKAADGMVKVTFKKEKLKEPVWDCKETNKIDRIDDSGNLVYRQDCKFKKWQTVVIEVNPVTVEERFASALKAGRYAEIITFDDRVAMPLRVFDTPKRGKLFGVAGFGW
ncbi:hypothetical protein ACLESO_32865 [Pyxidicoccus sp. 3LG]